MPQSEIPTPSAGLRQPGVRLRNKSNDIARVTLVVPAGDEIEASGYVAGQLVGQSQAFVEIDGSPAAASGGAVVEPGEDDPPSSSPVPSSDVEEAGGGAARRRGGRRA